MSIFDGCKEDAGKITPRMDDQPGVYWQRIERVREEVSQNQHRYLKIYKTIVRTEDGTLRPGDEVTHALFRSGKGDMFERDIRRVVAGCYGLDYDEVNAQPFSKVAEAFMSLAGTYVEVRGIEREKKNKPGEFYTLVTYRRPLLAEEIREHGLEDVKART